jgi:rod shape-determining protein MreD
MKYFLYFIAVIILAALNVGLFSHLKFLGAAPDLLLLFVIAFSLEKDNDDNFIVATMSGLMLDLYSGLMIGSFALSFLLVAILLQLFLKRFLVNDLTWKTVVLMVVAATALATGSVVGLNALAGAASLMPFYLVPRAALAHLLPEIIYNIALLYPVYLAASWLKSLILELTVKRRYMG